jgi:hypothetical protein
VKSTRTEQSDYTTQESGTRQERRWTNRVKKSKKKQLLNKSNLTERLFSRQLLPRNPDATAMMSQSELAGLVCR